MYRVSRIAQCRCATPGNKDVVSAGLVLLNAPHLVVYCLESFVSTDTNSWPRHLAYFIGQSLEIPRAFILLKLNKY